MMMVVMVVVMMMVMMMMKTKKKTDHGSNGVLHVTFLSWYPHGGDGDVDHGGGDDDEM